MGRTYTVIAVDDDKIYTELMQRYVEQVDFLELLETFNDPIMGIMQIEKQKPDLVFLDFEMPGVNAYDVLDAMVDMPAVVIVSSHWEHEKELIEKGAKKLVVKPIKSAAHLAEVAKEALGID